ncbi:hypothetical protein J6590_039137 [Homalodisca vitripennis]|nr:hypothetical protein J6590_039137 [Homalodisca vitripennis]
MEKLATRQTVISHGGRENKKVGRSSPQDGVTNERAELRWAHNNSRTRGSYRSKQTVIVPCIKPLVRVRHCSTLYPNYMALKVRLLAVTNYCPRSPRDTPPNPSLFRGGKRIHLLHPSFTVQTDVL